MLVCYLYAWVVRKPRVPPLAGPTTCDTTLNLPLRLITRAWSSWAVEGDQGQIVVRYDRKRSGKLTLWLSGRPGDRDGQGVDGECPNDEEGDSSFGEHDDMGCYEEEQITTTPGLKFGR